jgi:hypothetical protein
MLEELFGYADLDFDALGQGFRLRESEWPCCSCPVLQQIGEEFVDSFNCFGLELAIHNLARHDDPDVRPKLCRRRDADIIKDVAVDLESQLSWQCVRETWPLGGHAFDVSCGS